MVTSPQQQAGGVRSPGTSRSRQSLSPAAVRRRRSKLLGLCCAVLLLLLGIAVLRPLRSGADQWSVLLVSHKDLAAESDPTSAQRSQQLPRRAQQGATAQRSTALQDVSQQLTPHHNSQQQTAGGQHHEAAAVRAIAPERSESAKQPQRHADGGTVEDDTSGAAADASADAAADTGNGEAGSAAGAELAACMLPPDPQPPPPFSTHDFLAARPARWLPCCAACTWLAQWFLRQVGLIVPDALPPEDAYSR